MDSLFGIRSVLLLIALIQGFVFALLLIARGVRKKQVQDFYLAGLLVALATSLISHIIGFMGIYDKARNEGWDLTFFPFGNPYLYGPFILLYVRAVTDREYRWTTREWWHFLLPAAFYIRSFILAVQPFQRKVWWDQQVHWEIIIWEVLIYVVIGWYAWKSWDRLKHYHKLVLHEFSNAASRTLVWLRAFLLAFTVYFAIDLLVLVIGSFANFYYTEWYYLELLRAGLLYYICISGWGFVQKSDVPFDQIDQREHQIDQIILENNTNSPLEKANLTGKSLFTPDELQAQRNKLVQYMDRQKPWLDEELTLSQLATQLNLNPVQLSALVNNAMGKNFNDFVNEYRVEAVKKRLAEGAGKQFSLLGIAYECGFNSKATFNRAFKKQTGMTPGEFLPADNPSNNR